MSPLFGAYDPGPPASRRGPFVILEGISGIGKSTLARLLTDRLGAGTLHTVPDRYVSSVIAYHSAVHELHMDQVRTLIAPFRPYLVTPERTFYLRCRLDRLRANFDTVAAQDPTSVVVDTDDHTPEELADQIADRISKNCRE